MEFGLSFCQPCSLKNFHRKQFVTKPSFITWQDNCVTHTGRWNSEAGYPPPNSVLPVDDTITADAAYWRACAGTALLYAGDFQNARQLLTAVTRRATRKPAKPCETLLQSFHQHRARQISRANITNKILIELRNGECTLNRSPNFKEAVEAALGDTAPEILVLSLREALGTLGAHEWWKKGVYVRALKANVHAAYGVFSPIRGEYLDLIHDAPLNAPSVAWDIGTGTGIIAILLAFRGVQKIIGTDTSRRALRCAASNIHRKKMETNISLTETNMFPEGTADLIVCNPPWIPATVKTPIEQAIYDPKSQMLRSFLGGVKNRLNPRGEAWLIMSNLAELIGLRSGSDLQNWIAEAGLQVVEQHNTSPQHPKASDASDPLHEARSREVTSLYRLRPTHEQL